MNSSDPLVAVRRRGRPTGWVIGAVGAAVALVVGVLAVVGSRDDGPGSAATDGGDLGFVEIPTDGGREVAVGAGAVWVASDGGVVLRIDPASGEVTDEYLVLRIDPDSLEVTAEVELPAESFFDIAAGEGAAWATNETSEPAGESAVFKISD